MAAITFIGPVFAGLADLTAGSNFASLQEFSTFVGATQVSVWVCGTSAIGTYALQAVNYESFGDGAISEGTNPEPDTETGLNNTQSSMPYGDSWCTQFPYSGFFAAGTWELNVWTLRGVNAGVNSGASRLRMRIWQGSDPTGVGAVEITSGALVFPINSDTTQTLQLGTYSWSAPALTLDNEYLFFQVGYEITTDSAEPTQTINIYWGDGYTNIVSTDFEPAAFPVGLAATCVTPYVWPIWPPPMGGAVGDTLLFNIDTNPDTYHLPPMEMFFSGIEFIEFDIHSNAALSGVVGTLSPGTLTPSIVESYNEATSHAAGTGGVGAPTFEISSSVTLTGLAAAASLGGAYALLNPTTDVDGLAATGALGTATTDVESRAVVGVSPMEMHLGLVTFNFSFPLTGLSLTGTPGAVRPATYAHSVAAAGAVGIPSFTFDLALDVAGLAAMAVLGAVSPGSNKTFVDAPSVVAYGRLGNVYIPLPVPEGKSIAVRTFTEVINGADSSTAETRGSDIYVG